MKTLNKQLLEIFPELSKILNESEETCKVIEASQKVIEKVAINNDNLLASKEVMESCICRMNELIVLTEVKSDNKKDA